MRKKIIALALTVALALGAVPSFAIVNDYINGTTVVTTGTAFNFTTPRSFVWIKNDDAAISIFVRWYKTGDTLPGSLSSGGFEIKPGESFYRETKYGYQPFLGVMIYSGSATPAVRVIAGDN
jgi:hypothetical protein